MSFEDKANRSSFAPARTQEWQNPGKTLKFSNGGGGTIEDAAPVQVNKDSQIKIDFTGGDMVEIEFDCVSADYANAINEFLTTATITATKKTVQPIVWSCTVLIITLLY